MKHGHAQPLATNSTMVVTRFYTHITETLEFNVLYVIFSYPLTIDREFLAIVKKQIPPPLRYRRSRFFSTGLRVSVLHARYLRGRGICFFTIVSTLISLIYTQEMVYFLYIDENLVCDV